MNSTLRTAYLLQIHKNPDQVNKYITQLISEDQADVYVHIDSKSIDELNGKLIESPRVKILLQSISCDWGDMSQIDTTILLLKEVLSNNEEYDFVCLRSGQDMLIKNGFKQFLEQNKEKIFITLRDVTKSNLGLMKINWPKMTRRRFTTAHPIRIYRRIIQSLYRNGLNIFPNKKYWPKDYSFYVGSQWFTIPFETARYIIRFLEENPWYYEYFKDTMCPDEWFFQTLIMNSPYKDKVVNNNLFYFNWGKKFSERNSPQDLTIEDQSTMETSGKFFARKFDENIDSEIIDYFSKNVAFQASNSLKIEGIS